MLATIPKKHALFGSELKFVAVIWAKVRPTCTSKCVKRKIIRLDLKQVMQLCFIINHLARSLIDQVCGSGERLVLKLQRQRSLGKEG
jgi:hypothetical protein